MKLKKFFNFRFLLILILILIIIGIIWKRYKSKEGYKEIDPFGFCNINDLSIRSTIDGELKSGKKDNDHPLIAYKELDLSECQLTKIYNWVAHSLKFSILKLPKNIEEIGWSSFGNNKSLTEIEFPRSLKIIGSKAFMECSGLKKVTFHRIPSPKYYDESHIQILEQAFNFTKVVNVVINLRGHETFNNVKDVDGKTNETPEQWLNRLFSNPQHDLESEGVPNLKITINKDICHINNLTMDERVSLVNDDGLLDLRKCPIEKLYNANEQYHLPSYYNTKLYTIRFPPTLTEIGTKFFDGWGHGLSIVYLQDTIVNKIGAYAFNKCDFMRIEFPKTLTSINSNAFLNCKSLATVTFNSIKIFENKGLNDTAFSGCDVKVVNLNCSQNFDYYKIKRFFLEQKRTN